MHHANLSIVPSAVGLGANPSHRPHRRPEHQSERPTLGRILVENGALSESNLARAKALKQREDVRFEDILLHNQMAREAEIYHAMGQQFGTAVIDLDATPPDARLIDRLGVKSCIACGLTPWKRNGGATIIATSRPEEFGRFCATLPDDFGPVAMAIAPLSDIQNALMNQRLDALTLAAETKVPAAESCRNWNSPQLLRRALAGLLLFAGLTLIAPLISFAALCGWAVFSLVLTLGMKLSAACAQYLHVLRNRFVFQSQRHHPVIAHLPTVSVLVPLFREREIAGHLVKRLKALDYPKELLDIILVVEADDRTTRDVLAETPLPSWVRTIVVPRGQLRTKPRAMNYALDFCRGTIIGVYDAEDAPHPEQIRTIVHRFRERGPEVACLQGILDFYNSRSNWLSRCFSIEYATWFRVILPGLQKIGLAIPLGGTTLFFRRDALEKLGGWDAHNVTEDADLGIRLARHGFRTEVIETVTEEEANCRFLPWVKQRSRWLKGYAITWAVHMRNPLDLIQNMGWWKFAGVQVVFLGTLSQFLLAPILWSFWMIPLGLTHPLEHLVPKAVIYALGTLFLATEMVTIGVGMLSVTGNRHRFLLPWVLTMPLYFPLGALAAYKAFWEILTCPFYWDKTSHGIVPNQKKNAITRKISAAAAGAFCTAGTVMKAVLFLPARSLAPIFRRRPRSQPATTVGVFSSRYPPATGKTASR